MIQGSHQSTATAAYLSTQVEVTQQHRGLRTRDDQNDENQKQEAKHVVGLVGPQRIEDEEQLDKDAAERKHASHDDARGRARVNTLIRHLSRDLICSHWVFNRLHRRKE